MSRAPSRSAAFSLARSWPGSAAWPLASVQSLVSPSQRILSGQGPLIELASEQSWRRDPIAGDDLHDANEDAAAFQLASGTSGVRVKRRTVDPAMTAHMNHRFRFAATADARNRDVISVVS